MDLFIKKIFIFEWRENKTYSDKAEFCKSVSFEDIKKNFSRPSQ